MSMRNYALAVVMTILVAGCAAPSGEALVHESVIVPGHGYTIDTVDDFPLLGHSKTVKPGVHHFDVTEILYSECLSCKDPVFNNIACQIKPGFQYAVTRQGCGILYSASKEAAMVHYQTYQQALKTTQPDAYLHEMERDINKYIPTDPDKLLAAIAHQFSVEREKEEMARKQRLLEIQQQQQAQLREIADFRRHVKSGDDSNCGMVVRVKKQIILVQSSQGQIWVKRSELFPQDVAHGCRYGG